MQEHESNCLKCGKTFTMCDETKWPRFRDQKEDRTGLGVFMEIVVKRWFKKRGDDRIHTEVGGLCATCLEEFFKQIINGMRGRDG